jgi:hypothetical protein
MLINNYYLIIVRLYFSILIYFKYTLLIPNYNSTKIEAIRQAKINVIIICLFILKNITFAPTSFIISFLTATTIKLLTIKDIINTTAVIIKSPHKFKLKIES